MRGEVLDDDPHGVARRAPAVEERRLREFGEQHDHVEPRQAELSVMAGALMLSRASAGDELSERILDAAKEFLAGGRESLAVGPAGDRADLDSDHRPLR
ncbi:hypothetical protein GCM10027089_54240 [Nocardia thraciensis]